MIVLLPLGKINAQVPSTTDLPILAQELVRDSSGLSNLSTQLKELNEAGVITQDSIAKYYWHLAEETKGLHDFTLTHIIIGKSFEWLSDESDQNIVAGIHITLSDMAMEEDEIGKAVELLSAALDIYKEEQDSVNYLLTLRKIGVGYDYFGDHVAARLYYDECIEMAQALNREDVIGNCYNTIAGIYADEDDFQVAISYYDRGIEIALSIDDKNLLGKLYHNVSIAYRGLELFAEAATYLNKSMQVSIDIGDLKSIGFANQGFGFLYYDQRKYDLAEDYMEKTLIIARQISNNQLQSNAREILDKIYFETGRFEMAYENLKRIKANDDSLFNIENSALIQSIQGKYQIAKREGELAEARLKLQEADFALEKKNGQQIALLIGVILLILIVILLYGGYVLRQKANVLLTAKNEEIERLNRTKSRWFINVAHEFRSPLSMIKTPMSRVLSEFEHAEEVKSDLRLVDKSATKLNNLINEILELARMESGEIVLKEDEFDFSQLAQDAVQSFEGKASENGIELIMLPTSQTMVRGDRSKLRKVMDNLIGNAIKFSDRGDEIKVRIEQTKKLCIYVADNGIGIREHELPRVFDRFYQSEDNDQQMRRGTGIGLALSKEIALLHSAKLTVRSEFGKGSSFRLCLPKDRVI